MQTVWTIGFFVALVLLVLVASVVLGRSSLSRYELRRRKSKGDAVAARELERELALTDMLSLQKALTALLLVVTALFAVAAFGWLIGVTIAALVALAHGRIARFGGIAAFAKRLYQPYDASLVQFVKKRPLVGKAVRSVSLSARNPSLGSRDELEHLVEAAGNILAPNEKKLITNGLRFTGKTVGGIMTPRDAVKTIEKGEIMGPLVLDDMHKTGHSRFPVIDGDIDHVIGILHARELLALGNKSSQTAEQAMEKNVQYITQHHTLNQALAAFIKTHHHLLVVVNDSKQTVGIITLADVVKALLGRDIKDELDQAID